MKKPIKSYPKIELPIHSSLYIDGRWVTYVGPAHKSTGFTIKYVDPATKAVSFRIIDPEHTANLIVSTRAYKLTLLEKHYHTELTPLEMVERLAPSEISTFFWALCGASPSCPISVYLTAYCRASNDQIIDALGIALKLW